MFGNKKIKSSKIDTLIGEGVELTGNINFRGGLHLDGVINGNVTSAADAEGAVLVISERGRVEGDVYVAYAVINGEVTGNVYASEKLELSAKARISGNVEYHLLEKASGAEINGAMLHRKMARKLPAHPIGEAPIDKDSTDESSGNVHHLDDAAAGQN
jgi:cytoskeletal protein CcmA (bactofilin family)